MISTSNIFTTEDWELGDCTYEQVGQPRITPTVAIPTQPTSLAPLQDLAAMSDSELALASTRTLREAALTVFHQAGGQAWLLGLAQSSPKDFLKLLQRLLPQTIEATVQVQQFEVPKHIATLTLDDLKSMARGHGHVIDTAVTDVEPRAPTATPAPAPATQQAPEPDIFDDGPPTLEMAKRALLREHA